MDRKAFRNCGAALASLGAILSAGCGASSDGPATAAPTASLPVATEREQRAVIVSRAASEARRAPQIEENELVEDVVGTPIEVVAIEPEPSEPSITAVAAVEEIEPAPAEDTDADPALTASSLDAQADAAGLEPEPVTTALDGISPSASEIRFAPSSDAASDANALEYRFRRQADQGERKLMPVMVTPRANPVADRELAPPPAAVESPRESGERGAATARPPVAEPVAAAARPPAAEPIAAAASPPEAEPIASANDAVAGEPVAAPPTPLPPVRVAPSPAMAAATARVQERVRHGIRLADKGALYAARREFTAAVKMIAQAQDVDQLTRRHTRAAIAGFVALKEADDFVGQNAELGDLDVGRLVSGHKTPVLKDEDVADMPPTVAAGYYFNYAKDQLAEAVGHETTGSIALYGLGKLVVAGAGANSRQLEYTGPAMVLFQAALICEPENFRAEHELGVLLAGNGQLELARQMLISSAGKSPQPVMWRNLAKVHARMGERQLAEKAQQNADVLQQANPESKAPPVQWVDPATFARTVSVTDPSPPPPVAPMTQSTPAKSPQSAAKKKAKVAKKRPNRWDPLNLRR